VRCWRPSSNNGPGTLGRLQISRTARSDLWSAWKNSCFLSAEMIPPLLHLSVLLFFGGLADFLSNVNHTIGCIMTTMIALGFLIYIILTIIPPCIPNSPNHTPLSLIWRYTTEVTIYSGFISASGCRSILCRMPFTGTGPRFGKACAQRSNRGQFNRPR
jgi:hypothetical protein